MTTTPGNALRVLALRDDRPGHYNQTRGVYKALTLRTNCRIEWLEARMAARGFKRKLLIRTAGFAHHGWHQRLVRGCYRDLQAARARPDLIVSSGGRTALLNILLAHEYGCPNLFIGELDDALRKRFDWLLQYGSRRADTNLLHVDSVPSEIYRPDLEQAADRLFAGDGWRGARLWALFVGGDSRSHRYREHDWETLAAALVSLAQAHGVRWLLTTSRRTGRDVEARLCERLPGDLLFDATWYADDPRPVVAPYLGAAEVVFCTQDSLSMLSEAVAADLPTYALVPADYAAEEFAHSDYARYTNSLVERHLIRRVPLAALAAVDPAADLAEYFKRPPRPPLEALADLLATLVLPMLGQARA